MRLCGREETVARAHMKMPSTTCQNFTIETAEDDSIDFLGPLELGKEIVTHGSRFRGRWGFGNRPYWQERGRHQGGEMGRDIGFRRLVCTCSILIYRRFRQVAVIITS